MTESARPLRETVAKFVGDGITRHVNGVTSMWHNKTAIATVARQVSEDIEAVVLAETEQLDLDLAAARSEVADRDERIAAQDRLIRMLEGQRRSDGGLIDRYRIEVDKLRARVESITAERDHAEEQVHKIRMLKFWTNEDRKDFFFAADVWDITDPGRHGRPAEPVVYAPCLAECGCQVWRQQCIHPNKPGHGHAHWGLCTRGRWDEPLPLPIVTTTPAVPETQETMP